MKRTSSTRTAKLADVARLARVSTATVSRTLTLPHKVKPTTAARINQAVETLGYVAHGAARALASRRTRTIGAILPTLENSVFAKTLQALQRSLDQAGYMLVVASDEHDTLAETRVARALIEHGVDGLVLLGTTHHDCVLKMLDTHQVPYVLIWAQDPEGRLPCVGVDNRTAGERITRYLLDLGHREFAVISGVTAGNERAQERLRGVREALDSHGIILAAHRLVEKPYTLDGGREGLLEVIDAAGGPTAVICGNDALAIGALAECHERGITVPGELSITGFDDREIAAVVTPGLTTVHFPAAELGALAAQHLLARLGGREIALRTELPVELVVRGSTAPPASGRRDS